MKKASEPVIGCLVEACLVLLPVVDVGKLIRRTVLAPTHCNITVEGQGSVSHAFANQTLLVGAATLALRGAPRMEPGAPATAPHAIVLLRQVGEGFPCRGI